MNWTAFSKRLYRLGALLALALVAYRLLHLTAFYDFTARESEGLNTLILLVGSIYAVMLAFVTFVIWGQFTDVENFVMRECNALNDLIRFSHHLPPDPGRAVRRAVADYVQHVLHSEWQALADRQRDPDTERCFTAVMNAVIRTAPVSDAGAALHERMIDIAARAGEHRDERVTKSLTRIPPTLSHLVNTMAAALLMLVFVYPFHHWLAGAACFSTVAIVLYMADGVITDTDNPFEGVCNVSPQPFADIEAR